MLSSYEKIEQDPNYQELVRRRSSLGWTLSLIMLVIYFGFILLVAYAPKFLGMPLGAGVMTVGIPIGLSVIVSAFVLTGIYVRQANSEYDAADPQIVEETVMRKISWLLATLLICFPTLALAAGAIEGGSKQATNWSAIGMFIAFVSLTLGITYWAASGQIGGRFLLRQAAESPASRTASPSPATTCRRPRSWASRASSHLRLRRPDLLGGLAGRLADRHCS